MIGQIKCGTTDLFDKLVWHPDILEPPIGKEIRWWSKARFERKSFKKYLENMTPKDISFHKNGLLVDGDPNILYQLEHWYRRYPWAKHPPYTNADLIKLITPKAKIIAVFRNPVDRLWSGYLWTNFGNANTIHGHVVRDINKFNNCLEKHDFRHCCYNEENNLLGGTRLNMGIYMCFVADFKETFGHNMHILTTEEYSNNQLETMKTLYNFLEVSTDIDFSPLQKIFNERFNERKTPGLSKGELPAQTRNLLEDFYRPYNEELAEYLGDSKYLFNEEVARDKGGRKYGGSKTVDERRKGKPQIKW